MSAAIRIASGLAGGDPITVTLPLAETPREVTVPHDLAAALAAAPGARDFFDSINGAKSADARQRRIDKSVGLFLAGKQR